MSRVGKVCLAVAALVCQCLVVSCGGKGGDEPDERPVLPDTLRIATFYGPLSFFLFRGDTLGYDFSLIRDFAQSKNLVLDIEIPSNLEEAITMLDSGRVDVIVYGIPNTSLFKDHLYSCGPEMDISQVLVQNAVDRDSLVTDVTQLNGRSVWVEKGSSHFQRLANLNSEIGGGIVIVPYAADTLSQEDVVRLVAKRKIPMAVVDGDIGRLNRTYYPNIDVSLRISLGQYSSWAVAPERGWLGDSITEWFNSEGTKRNNEILLKRYFEMSKGSPDFNLFMSLKKGRISDYDSIFKEEAARIGWDWRLLAAQAFVESQFNNNLVSWAGARGIMQVMPSTAEAYHINPDLLTDPRQCIKLAADVLKTSEDVVGRYVDDPEQKRIMAVAAYNSGVAHIVDAISLSPHVGLDSCRWKDNVEKALQLKSEQRFYTLPAVKYGYFRGTQTVQYVDEVFDLYKRFCKHVKR